MEKFKLVQEESFESISRYLNLIYQLTELENPLAFVDVDSIGSAYSYPVPYMFHDIHYFLDHRNNKY